MYSEITLEVFKRIVPVDVKPIYTEDLEHASKTTYYIDGVYIVVVSNYLSCVVQYYVRDINA